VGLTREDLAKARSFGIRGLHERAGTVGGWVDLTSSARGTTLILSVPLQDEGHPATAHAGGTAAPPVLDAAALAEAEAWSTRY
jgi:signal transduction histidine kinase